MKFSELWLREGVNPAVTTDELAKILTMAGLEMESIEPVAGDFDKTVVGQVKTIEPHPDANKLNVCNVDVGDKKLLQIVCGAPNVRAGFSYPVALPGARLPGGVKIRATKLRGIKSHGMLCSETELNLGEGSDGIMELAGNPTVGLALQEYLKLDDAVIELDLTPNRGDCLGVLGVAREVAVMNEMAFECQHVHEVPAKADADLPVELLDAGGCQGSQGWRVGGVASAARGPRGGNSGRPALGAEQVDSTRQRTIQRRSERRDVHVPLQGVE